MFKIKAHQLAPILVFFLLIPTSSSIKYDSVKITSDIVEDTVYINYVLEAIGPADKINISVPLRSKVIYFSDPYSPLIEYKIYSNAVVGELKVPIKEGEKRIILLKVKSKYPIFNKLGIIEYISEFEFLEGVQDFEHLVLLPQGNKTKVIRANPKGGVETIGKQLSVRWNIKDYQSEVFFIEFQGAEKNYLFIVFHFLLVAILLVSGYIIYKYIRKKLLNKKVIQKTTNLPEREKKLLREILKEDGITQYKLRQIFNLSRSNTSKILTSLQRRGIIRKERTGRIAKIYLLNKNKENI